jgi:flagellar motor switch protein FliN/FliY
MTAVDTAVPSAYTDAVAAAAEAASRALPAETGWRVEVGDDPATLLPGDNAVAISAGLPALQGHIVLSVNYPLGRAVQVGPPPAEDLLGGLTPALELLAASLGEAVGGAVELSVPQEVGAAAALAPPVDGHVQVAVRLFDGDEHAATLALVVPPPAGDDDAAASADDISGHTFEDLSAPGARAATVGPLSLLHDVEMGVTVELGRTRMLVKDILAVAPGSVIELDRAAGSPVDVLVNGTLIARGEVVVIDEEFGIRITEIVGYDSEGRRT